PKPQGKGTMVGNDGDGHARITIIKRTRNNIELKLKFDFQKLTDYTIAYNLDGGTLSNPIETYTRNSNDITLPTPTKLGYTFKGWVGGKNLYNINEITYAISKSLDMDTGEVVERGDSNWRVSSFIEVTGKNNYILSGYLTPENWNMRICLYDENQVFIKSLNYTNKGTHSNNYPISSDQGIYYIRLQAYFNKNYATAYDASTIQIEEGNKKTNYEAYINTPGEITIPKGSRGNRTYTAVWEPIDYNIDYDLDGGSLENPINTYNIESDDITLSTPTKDGYTFTGWTIGKNLFNNTGYTNNGSATSQRLNDGSIKINPKTNSASGIYFGLTGNYYLKYIYLKDFVLSFDLKADVEKRISVCIDNKGGSCKYVDLTTSWQRVYLIQKNFDNSTWHAFTVYNNSGSGTNTTDSFYIRNIQIEYGDTNTDYESYIRTANPNVIIEKGSKGNRIYYANWKDVTAPTLSLSKETYIEGFDNWETTNGRIEDDILILGEDSETGNAKSPFYETNYGSWYYTFDAYTTGYLSEEDVTKGGVHTDADFYKSTTEMVRISGNLTNGFASNLVLGEWKNDISFNAYNRGNDAGEMKYLKVRFSTGDQWSAPVVKIRNLKIHGTAIPNSFYDILVSSSDNEGVTTTKYAKGSQTADYFKTNGEDVTDNQIRVTENGIYTVYVADAAGNSTVKEIEITNITNAG
ncbi:MAG: InlB B-repeat-containing protein, partial [Bacilli bacterium]|nr:InlB B-repeat-containing protein [Bacilli bacterium]